MTPALRSWLGALLLAVVLGAALPAPAFAQTYARGGVLLDWSQDTPIQGWGLRKHDAPRPSMAAVRVTTARLGALMATLESSPGWNSGSAYAIVPALRLEAAVQYRPDFSFDGRANFGGGALDDRSARQDVAADLSSLSGMLAAYLDISELLLFQYTPIGPFIGLGGGLSRIEIGETRMDFPKTYTIVPGGHHVSFAWMLTAGVAVSISPRLTLDVGWRYTDHGTIETASDEGRVVWRDESREPLKLDLAETKSHLRSHGLNVSLRYAF